MSREEQNRPPQLTDPNLSPLASRLSPALQIDVERLLYYEAYLLDEKRLYEWLDLFTEDATYTISVHEAAQPQDEGIAPLGVATPPLAKEGRSVLSTRVKRLDTRLAHAEQPPSLTRHLITNVLVHEELGDEVRVSSNFQVYQARVDISEHVFYGKREDVLRRVDGQWRIAERHIVLDTALLPRTLSVFF